jgi:hypothetical protein
VFVGAQLLHLHLSLMREWVLSPGASAQTALDAARLVTNNNLEVTGLHVVQLACHVTQT